MGLSQDNAFGFHLALLVLALSLCAVICLGYLTGSVHLNSQLACAMRFLVSCPFRALTGTACPFCGTTTAFVLLLQGDIPSSVRANPMAMALTPAILAQLIYRPLRIWRPALKWKEETLLVALCLVTVLAVFVLRDSY